MTTLLLPNTLRTTTGVTINNVDRQAISLLENLVPPGKSGLCVELPRDDL